MREPDEMDTAEFPAFSTRPARPADTPVVPVQVDIGARSHIGKVRANNEDHYLVARISRSLRVLATNLPPDEAPELVEDDGYAYVVADGMGGMAAGEEASMLALRTGLKLVLGNDRWCLKIDEKEVQALTQRMRAYFQEVDRTLLERAQANPGLAGMATTLTVAYSVGDHMFIVHAGDTRVYLLRDGQLRQLTRDHTVAQALASSGRIKAEDVKRHPSRHVVTNCAGGLGRGIQPEVATLRLADGDCILLCSDGLTEMVADPAIAETLCTHVKAEKAAQALVNRALAQGGRDNITVIVARYAIPVPSSPPNR